MNYYYYYLLTAWFVHNYLIFTACGKSGILSCSICCKEFYHLDSLKKHMANLHGYLKGPVTCTTCGRTMKNKNSLYAHIYNYHKRWADGIFTFNSACKSIKWNWWIVFAVRKIKILNNLQDSNCYCFYLFMYLVY